MSKRHKTKINEGSWKITSCTKIQAWTSKNIASKEMTFIFIRYFFFQTNLVFKFNSVIIGKFDKFCHNLFTFLPFDCWYSTDLAVHLASLRPFLHKRKCNCDESQCSFFFKVSASKWSYNVRIVMTKLIKSISTLAEL